MFASHIANLCTFFSFWCRGSSAFLSNSRFAAFDYDIKMLKLQKCFHLQCAGFLFGWFGFYVCASVHSGLASLKLLLLISYPCHPLQSTPPQSLPELLFFVCVTLLQMFNPAGVPFLGKISITSTEMFAFKVKVRT